MEGHFTEPKEQNTQQSPGWGLSRVPQPLHSWKNRHVSVGIVSALACPHFGHVSTDSRVGSLI
jgi:hypothetical protein